MATRVPFQNFKNTINSISEGKEIKIRHILSPNFYIEVEDPSNFQNVPLLFSNFVIFASLFDPWPLPAFHGNQELRSDYKNRDFL